jgi:hypothetical protein
MTDAYNHTFRQNQPYIHIAIPWFQEAEIKMKYGEIPRALEVINGKPVPDWRGKTRFSFQPPQGSSPRSQGSPDTQDKREIDCAHRAPGAFKALGDGNKALDRDLPLKKKMQLKVSKFNKQHLDSIKALVMDKDIEERLNGLSRGALMGWVNAGRMMQWLEFESGGKMVGYLSPPGSPAFTGCGD